MFPIFITGFQPILTCFRLYPYSIGSGFPIFFILLSFFAILFPILFLKKKEIWLSKWLRRFFVRFRPFLALCSVNPYVGGIGGDLLTPIMV